MTDNSLLTSLDFLSEFLLILLSCMKLNEQEKMPLCVLYSMDFWLFMMSPEEKLAGILEGEGVSKGVKGRRREGEGEGRRGKRRRGEHRRGRRRQGMGGEGRGGQGRAGEGQGRGREGKGEGVTRSYN